MMGLPFYLSHPFCLKKRQNKFKWKPKESVKQQYKINKQANNIKEREKKKNKVMYRLEIELIEILDIYNPFVLLLLLLLLSIFEVICFSYYTFEMEDKQSINHDSRQKRYNVIGMMSGTSLDGVDLAFCTYFKNSIQTKWNYHLHCYQTYPYSQWAKKLLIKMQQQSITYMAFIELQLKYSEYLVKIYKQFIQKNKIDNYDFVSMHGHTIFHKPNQMITVQVGNISYISAQMSKSVIGNFRQFDVFKGGQGAPLVPYGEQLFQNEADAFLNLGGIANIGYHGQGTDINFCNMFFNYCSQKLISKQYDQNGRLGRTGNYNQQIYKYLINNNNYKLGHSLGRQQFNKFLQKLLNNLKQYRLEDILTTYYQFLAQNILNKIYLIVKDSNQKYIKILCSGGGTYNQYLLQIINKFKSMKQYNNFEFIVPEKSIIEQKQAIIFGLLGVKFLQKQINCEHGTGGVTTGII